MRFRRRETAPDSSNNSSRRGDDQSRRLRSGDPLPITLNVDGVEHAPLWVFTCNCHARMHYGCFWKRIRRVGKRNINGIFKEIERDPDFGSFDDSGGGRSIHCSNRDCKLGQSQTFEVIFQ
jgi:hypothetical protein